MGPCFGLLVTSPLGFKARVGSALFELSGGICVTLHVPWDSPLVGHLPTSWQPAWQPSHLHIPVGHWWDSKPGAIMPPLTVWDQADALPTELSRLGNILFIATVSNNVYIFSCHRALFDIWNTVILATQQNVITATTFSHYFYCYTAVLTPVSIDTPGGP